MVFSPHVSRVIAPTSHIDYNHPPIQLCKPTCLSGTVNKHLMMYNVHSLSNWRSKATNLTSSHGWHGGRLCTLFFSRLCTLIFSRLCTLTSSTLSDMLRNIGNSRAIEAVNFFSLVHPGALFLDLGSLLHPGRLLQVRKCDLYEVTSVMPSMLGRSIFLKWLSRPCACCFEPSSSSTFDAML